jgi:hypothetical protein
MPKKLGIPYLCASSDVFTALQAGQEVPVALAKADP